MTQILIKQIFFLLPSFFRTRSDASGQEYRGKGEEYARGLSLEEGSCSKESLLQREGGEGWKEWANAPLVGEFCIKKKDRKYECDKLKRENNTDIGRKY